MKKSFFYLRDNNNHPFGAIAMESCGDEIRIAYSICHKVDSFEKTVARHKTFGRLKSKNKCLKGTKSTMKNLALDAVVPLELLWEYDKNNQKFKKELEFLVQ